MNLLTICKETGKLKVNSQQTIFLLIREADCLAKLSLSIPMVALTLLSKRDHFTLLQDSLQVSKNYMFSKKCTLNSILAEQMRSPLQEGCISIN